MARFEAFWEVACDFRDYMWLGITALIFFLILTILSLAWGEPGTGSYAIALLNLAMILVMGAVIGWMFWVCQRRRTEEY